MTVAFVVGGIVAVIGTVLAVTRLHAVHALLYLIASLFGLAVCFYVLGAPFAAVLQIVVYAGAIAVLVLFVVMMLNLGAETSAERLLLQFPVWIGPAFLVLVLVILMAFILIRGVPGPHPAASVSPSDVGAQVFGPYVLAVEATSFLLLAAAVGAYHLGRRRFENDPHSGEAR